MYVDLAYCNSKFVTFIHISKLLRALAVLGFRHELPKCGSLCCLGISYTFQ